MLSDAKGNHNPCAGSVAMFNDICAMDGSTLVLGASTNPERYAYKAIERLRATGHRVVAIGLRPGAVADVQINTGQPSLDRIHTITLYLNAERQKEWYDYLLALHPKRIIFNPGTENSELRLLAENQGVICNEACTLVLLATGQYDA
jgi:uncharacterized protein